MCFLHVRKLGAKGELTDMKKYSLTIDKECAIDIYKGRTHIVTIYNHCIIFVSMDYASTKIKDYASTRIKDGALSTRIA